MSSFRENFFEKIDRWIRSEGFALLCIGPDIDVPPYAYTVGLTETYDCPELLIFGFGQQTAGDIFQVVVDKIRSGARFSDGDVLVDVLNVPCTIKAVSAEAALPYALNVASRYEGRDQVPTFQQIVYPDKAGVLPWQPGYNHGMKKIQIELWPALTH